MQEYKSSWVQATHTVYIKEAVRDTLQSSTDISSARPENDWQGKVWVFSNYTNLAIIVTADIAEQ